MNQTVMELAAANVEVRTDHPLAPYTTWKIGGPADLFVAPKNKEELQSALHIFKRANIPWFVLGKGSNTLFSDKGIRGAVIKLDNEFEQLRFDEEDKVYAGGAYSFIKMSVIAAKKGLTGLEFAGGIPGTVGGAVYMNAGAHGSDVSRVLISAEVALDTGELVVLQNEDLQYAYRFSLLQSTLKGIVTEAVFQLAKGDRKEIASAMATHKARRLLTQPLQQASSGSVFRNPPNDFSARLIESAGLKGTRVGGAEVSDKHANFIVNTGHATANDVLTLIEQIRQTVFEKNGILLETEVLMVGER